MNNEQEFWDAVNRTVMRNLFLQMDYEIMGYARHQYMFWFRYGGWCGEKMELNLN